MTKEQIEETKIEHYNADVSQNYQLCFWLKEIALQIAIGNEYKNNEELNFLSYRQAQVASYRVIADCKNELEVTKKERDELLELTKTLKPK